MSGWPVVALSLLFHVLEQVESLVPGQGARARSVSPPAFVSRAP
jgi:hypothetical protein